MTSSPSLPHGCSDQQGKEPASSPSYGTVRQAGGDGWQPIETAPKDGSYFMAARYAPGATLPMWIAMVEYGTASPGFIQCASYSGFFVSPPPIQSEKMRIKGRGGTEMHHGTLAGPDHYGPTHWRPLPDPPA